MHDSRTDSCRSSGCSATNSNCAQLQWNGAAKSFPYAAATNICFSWQVVQHKPSVGVDSVHPRCQQLQRWQICVSTYGHVYSWRSRPWAVTGNYERRKKMNSVLMRWREGRATVAQLAGHLQTHGPASPSYNVAANAAAASTAPSSGQNRCTKLTRYSHRCRPMDIFHICNESHVTEADRLLNHAQMRAKTISTNIINNNNNDNNNNNNNNDDNETEVKL